MSRTVRITLFTAALLLLGGAELLRAQAPAATTDSADVAHVVHRFHSALETADSATALRLLHEDAVILNRAASRPGPSTGPITFLPTSRSPARSPAAPDPFS